MDDGVGRFDLEIFGCVFGVVLGLVDQAILNVVNMFV